MSHPHPVQNRSRYCIAISISLKGANKICGNHNKIDGSGLWLTWWDLSVEDSLVSIEIISGKTPKKKICRWWPSFTILTRCVNIGNNILPEYAKVVVVGWIVQSYVEQMELLIQKR